MFKKDNPSPFPLSLHVLITITGNLPVCEQKNVQQACAALGINGGNQVSHHVI